MHMMSCTELLSSKIEYGGQSKMGIVACLNNCLSSCGFARRVCKINGVELLMLAVGFGGDSMFIFCPCDVLVNEDFFHQCAKAFGLALEGFALGFMFEFAGDGSWSVLQAGLGICEWWV